MKNTLSLFAAATALTAPLFAADGVEEIEITATRTPTLLSEVAGPVTVLTADDLAARQIYQVADALKALPGVSLAHAGSIGGQSQLRLRGAEANQTLILIDGVEMNDPAAGDEVQFEHLTALGIERIEMVRGPMSAQWGSDAVSGVINIVTRRADGPELAASLEGGSFGTLRGTVTAGSSGDGWHILAGAGYSDSRGTNASREGDEKDGYENASFNLKAGAALSENIEFLVTARHTDTVSEFDAIDFLSGLPSDSDNVTDTAKTYVSASLKGAYGDGVFNQDIRVTWLDTQIKNFAGGVDDGTTGAERLGFYLDNRIRLMDGHRIVVALDHERTDFKQRGIASPWGNPNQEQDMTVTGYVLEYQGRLLDRLSTTVTVRRDDNSDFRNATSWRVGGAYKLDDAGSRIFANISKGQKAPTFIERFGFFSDVFQGNPDLEAETATNMELGFEAVAADGAYTFSATLFRTRLKNEIDGFVFDPVTFGFTADNKDGKSKREGLELTLEKRLTDTLGISARYSYVKAQEEDATGAFVREVRRPRHQGGAVLSYTPDEGVEVTLDASYTGAAEDIFFPPWPNPSERVSLKDYVLVRLAASYRLTDTITAYGRVENMLDETYEDVYGFANPGVAAYAGLRIRY